MDRRSKISPNHTCVFDEDADRQEARAEPALTRVAEDSDSTINRLLDDPIREVDSGSEQPNDPDAMAEQATEEDEPAGDLIPPELLFCDGTDEEG